MNHSAPSRRLPMTSRPTRRSSPPLLPSFATLLAALLLLPLLLPLSSPASDHWSLQPLRDPAIPAPPASRPPGAPALHPVDAFLLARLAPHGLAYAPPANRPTLIRRLAFDLTGLPPSPAEIDAFVADPSPQAYETLVERLLASPRYGERWGRHWLDLVRYTESQGFEYDRLRDHAWHYRDYVIRSLNDDKPYDRFMREQIAGDVLEPVTADGIVATSLLVCGAYDEAGNAQANATQKAITREDEMEDLIGVVAQTFLGLTVNCARCHAHKSDPIPLDEYYRVKAVFDGVKHGERPIASPDEVRARDGKIAALKRDIAEARAAAAEIETVGRRLAMVRRTPIPAAEPGPAPRWQWNFDGSGTNAVPGELRGDARITSSGLRLPREGSAWVSAPLDGDVTEKTLEAWVALDSLEQGGGAALSLESPDGRVFDALVFGERQPRKWIAGSSGFERTRDLDAPEETAAPGEWIHVAAVHRADRTIAFFRNGVPYGKPYRPDGPLPRFAAGQARVLLGQRHTGGGRPWLLGTVLRASLHDRALSDAEVAASFRAPGIAISLEEALARLSPAERVRRDALLARVRELEKALAAVPPLPVSYAGTRIQPAPTQRLKRGDVKSPDGVVAPGALSAVPGPKPDFDLPPDAPEARRRLRFADWLADPANPLPARVMANRVWHFHFGHGLVTTPNDFGHAGARPSHPELLDWLATQFIRHRWSLKALHRLVVHSDAYRQSSAWNDAAARVDAEDQWLWRFPPRRLDAELVRDAMLAASGQLNLAMGGPGFRNFDVLKFPDNVYRIADKTGPEFNRRTVYRMNVNSGKEPLLDALDCPDPSVKTPRRGVTITPLQALGLMNGSFVQRQSRHLAERAQAEAGADLPRAVHHLYRLALGRPPTPEESRRAAAAARERDLASVSWALLNSTEFIYVR